MTILATDKSWNSATTLYIARRIHNIADGQKLKILDMGCGDGTILELLIDYGHDFYGYDFIERNEILKEKLEKYWKNDYQNHIRLMEDERIIPFDDDFFDIVYSNQVFEHVKFFSNMISECARVLKPNGILLANFPLATYPIEGHLKIPFAHWLPPGRVRISYLKGVYALGIRKKTQGCSAMETAVIKDKYLQEKTYYRFMNEVQNVSKYFFGKCELETNMFVRSKLDLMSVDQKLSKRRLGNVIHLFEGSMLDYIVTNFINAAFCMREPRK